MAGGKVFNNGAGSCSAGSASAPLLKNQASKPLNNLLISGSSSSSSPSFLAPRSMVNFNLTMKENGEEELDELYTQPEKKRRLSSGQVQFLEKSFEVDNKLEPERKTQLAKEIGLQPRQVAIWFQNRRARWKTKQLEKEFEVLQSKYDTLKADHQNILNEKDKLKAEVLLLSEKLLLMEQDNANLVQSEVPPESEIQKTLSKDEEDSHGLNLGCKIEDASSAKSDIFDSDKSDTSNEEEDSLNDILFPSYIFSKLSRDFDYSEPPTTSCSFGFQVEDNVLWSWS